MSMQHKLRQSLFSPVVKYHPKLVMNHLWRRYELRCECTQGFPWALDTNPLINAQSTPQVLILSFAQFTHNRTTTLRFTPSYQMFSNPQSNFRGKYTFNCKDVFVNKPGKNFSVCTSFWKCLLFFLWLNFWLEWANSSKARMSVRNVFMVRVSRHFFDPNSMNSNTTEPSHAGFHILILHNSKRAQRFDFHSNCSSIWGVQFSLSAATQFPESSETN